MRCGRALLSHFAGECGVLEPISLDALTTCLQSVLAEPACSAERMARRVLRTYGGRVLAQIPEG